MKKLLNVVLLTSAVFSLTVLPSPSQQHPSQEQARSSYIGTRYLSGESPQGTEERAGWLVGELMDSGDFWITQMRVDNQEMLWLQVRLGDYGQQAIFEVVDVADLPAFGESEGLVSACELNESPDPEIMAIVRYTDTEYLTAIRQAWRANRTSRKIEPISIVGVRCYNPGWGV